MELTPDPRWEQSLEQVARRFEYPPTPDLTTAVLTRAVDRQPAAGRRPPLERSRPAGRGRVGWALALLLLAALALLAAPPARAALLALFARVGAIRIFVDDTGPQPPATVAPPPAALPPSPGGAAGSQASPRATPSPTPVPHALLLLDLGPPLTTDEAARQAGFALRVPTALGAPDEVYVHPVDLPAVTLVWREEPKLLTLTEIGVGEFANKIVYQGGVEATTVNGRPAYWLPGPHVMQLLDGWATGGPLIASNVLIWARDGITYRLEGELTLDEAVVIAESLALFEND